jgi:hypothetical protein
VPLGTVFHMIVLYLLTTTNTISSHRIFLKSLVSSFMSRRYFVNSNVWEISKANMLLVMHFKQARGSNLVTEQNYRHKLCPAVFRKLCKKAEALRRNQTNERGFAVSRNCYREVVKNFCEIVGTYYILVQCFKDLYSLPLYLRMRYWRIRKFD